MGEWAQPIKKLWQHLPFDFTSEKLFNQALSSRDPYCVICVLFKPLTVSTAGLVGGQIHDLWLNAGLTLNQDLSSWIGDMQLVFSRLRYSEDWKRLKPFKTVGHRDAYTILDNNKVPSLYAYVVKCGLWVLKKDLQIHFCTSICSFVWIYFMSKFPVTWKFQNKY